MENKNKRKRTANFTSEEKLRFVRLLQQEGQSIISKVTSHDTNTNKEKEQAWAKITQLLNCNGDTIRTAEILKKQWGKLKSEAKTYKAASRRSVSGTGGGPSKKFDDPVLELVAEITGRASTGIINIDDCDADNDEAMTENVVEPSIEEYLDETFLEDLSEDKITATENSPVDITHKGVPSQKKEWAKRRRPNLEGPNERTEKIKNQQKISNRFAAERLKAEQEKNNLILQQQKQNMELHMIEMENENLKKSCCKH